MSGRLDARNSCVDLEAEGEGAVWKLTVVGVRRGSVEAVDC